MIAIAVVNDVCIFQTGWREQIEKESDSSADKKAF